MVTVEATDGDEDDFGRIIYSLAGAYKDAFNIGSDDGTVTVVDPGMLIQVHLLMGLKIS